MQHHSTMGNSLQATRAAAFAAAPVTKASSTPIITKNTTGGGTAFSGSSRPQSGGHIKDTVIAKADAPEVPRIPASRTPQTSTIQPRNVPAIPNSTTPQISSRGPAITPPIVSGSQSGGRQGTPKPTPMQSQSPVITKRAPGETVLNNGRSTPSPVVPQSNPFPSSTVRSQPGPSGSVVMQRPSQSPVSRAQAGFSTPSGTIASRQDLRVAPLVPGPARSYARTEPFGSDTGRSVASRPQFSGNRAAAAPPTMSTSPSFTPIPSGVGSSGRSTPAPVYRPEPSRSYSAPQYSAPTHSAPSYSAPVHSAPAPSYSAPVHSAPAPSYSAPAHSAPAAAPSSHSSSSSSGGRGGKDR
jgi:hypothetical protein